jgi:hypothetical protein
MKKLLFQFDTDAQASVFDTVVAYDGGADHVIGYANCKAEMIAALVEGTIFTRSESNKKYTAIFIGGSNINTGDALLDAIKKLFFDNFRVSVMLDCNGCNTTAAAAVTSVLKSGDIKGKKAVILAGTGPVGGRAAVMLARAGARVAITSRSLERSQQTCEHLQKRYGVEIEPLEAITREQRTLQIEHANIVLATGAAGVKLLEPGDWQNNPNLEVIVDANAVPPAGIGGVGMADRGKSLDNKIIWGPIGFGPAKLTLQRHCIGSLFKQSDLILDADEIFNIAKKMI